MISMTESGQSLYSTLAEDLDLADIVDLFVEEMPERVIAFQESLNAADWETLRRKAHQLKGAAGSYGFAPITDLAARLESAIREQQPEEAIRQAVAELIDLCQRARARPA